MIEQSKIIMIDGHCILLAWDESRTFMLCSAHKGSPAYLDITEAGWRLADPLGLLDSELEWRGSPVFFQLDVLDELLDALHEVRAEIAGTKRIARMLRLPIEMRNRLEAKVRREGGNQNAAIIEAIERYLAE